jgi:SHS2 domain-containing protein
MKPAFEFFEHTADIGVRVHGETLPALFENAAAALYAAMGELARGPGTSQWTLELEAPTLEDLLHDWLAELLFDLAAHNLVYDERTVTGISPVGLTATLRGGPVDLARSAARAEIKAVTYHQLRVAELPDGTWQATIIFDV